MLDLKIKNQDFLKWENQSLVLDMIRRQGPISRAEIAKRSSMSATSASRIVATLEQMNLIREVDDPNQVVGRKATYYIPNEDAVISIGVEIDIHRIQIGMMNFVGDLLVLESYPYEIRDPEEAAIFIASKIDTLITGENIPSEVIAGICVGLPGLIDHELVSVTLSTQLNWRSVPFASLLEQESGLAVVLENELNVKALGEFTFNDQVNPQEEDLVMIGFGSGVGSALIRQGEIARGAGNYAGEIGHTIVDPSGMYCPCGNYGCLQTYIAEQSLLEQASKTKPIHHFYEIITAYQQEEKWAINLMEKAITYAAIAVNNVVCMYSPNRVVLSGELVENYPIIREKIIDTCHHYIWEPLEGRFTLEMTTLGNKSAILGAAFKVQRQFIANIWMNSEE